LRLLHRHHLVAVVHYFSIIGAVVNVILVQSLHLVVGAGEGTRVLHELFLGRRTISAFFTVHRVRVWHALRAVLALTRLLNTKVAVSLAHVSLPLKLLLLTRSNWSPLLPQRLGLIVPLLHLFCGGPSSWFRSCM
jgi:hypothetical protein